MTPRPHSGIVAGAPIWKPALQFLSALALAVLLLGAAEAPPKPTPLEPAEAAKQGRALAAEILAQKPAENATNTGVMKIRDGKGKRREVSITFAVFPTPPNWVNTYQALENSNRFELTVTHVDGRMNEYRLKATTPVSDLQLSPAGIQIMVPFAGSDFWIADLGLEFFHWPEQRLVKSEMRSSRPCHVLESINPHPAAAGYSRVLSWVDDESHGIISAEAYDANNRILKVFAPKGIKKVNGQWELEGMEIDNRQTGSRTRIEFNLDGK